MEEEIYTIEIDCGELIQALCDNTIPFDGSLEGLGDDEKIQEIRLRKLADKIEIILYKNED